jgi:hypothetical protein
MIVREPRPGDAPGLARIHRENTSYYAALAPDLFQVPAVDGLAELMAPKPEDNDGETTFAAVVEVDGEVAGYLEARIEPPLETAAWQGNIDLGGPRLFINYWGQAMRSNGRALRRSSSRRPRAGAERAARRWPSATRGSGASSRCRSGGAAWAMRLAT